MTISFFEKSLEEAPAAHTRVRLTEGKTTRFVKENSVEWLELGVGPWKDVTRRQFLLVCRTIIKAAKEQRIKKLALKLDKSLFPQMQTVSLPELGRIIAENLSMANFEFSRFKTPSEDGPVFVEDVLVCGDTPEDMREGFRTGQIVGEGVNACRELANTPGGDMTPTKLAEAARTAAQGLPVEVSVFGRAELEKLGMGGVLAVSKGSSEEPKFIVMEYKGAEGQPIVLVGKGVTFDSGGLNIKTGDHMYEMHMDMSGGGAVISAVALAAKLGLKKHVVGLVPAVENMLASNAVRPGDIYKSLSGKTVEVTDTDAEGRIILADALTYAKRVDPAVVLDTATLTGSSISALGLRAIAMLSRDDALSARLAALAEESGDYLWRLPLWDEYEENIKGSFADLVNYPSGASARPGDVINASMFLWQFAKEIGAPWAHLDIAPRMTAIEADKLAKGAAGAPVRLFVRFIEQWEN